MTPIPVNRALAARYVPGDPFQASTGVSGAPWQPRRDASGRDRIWKPEEGKPHGRAHPRSRRDLRAGEPKLNVAMDQARAGPSCSCCTSCGSGRPAGPRVSEEEARARPMSGRWWRGRAPAASPPTRWCAWGPISAASWRRPAPSASPSSSSGATPAGRRPLPAAGTWRKRRGHRAPGTLPGDAGTSGDGARCPGPGSGCSPSRRSHGRAGGSHTERADGRAGARHRHRAPTAPQRASWAATSGPPAATSRAMSLFARWSGPWAAARQCAGGALQAQLWVLRPQPSCPGRRQAPGAGVDRRLGHGVPALGDHVARRVFSERAV